MKAVVRGAGGAGVKEVVRGADGAGVKAVVAASESTMQRPAVKPIASEWGLVPGMAA